MEMEGDLPIGGHRHDLTLSQQYTNSDILIVGTGVCIKSRKFQNLTSTRVEVRLKRTNPNPPLKKSLNIPELYAKMFGRFH